MKRVINGSLLGNLFKKLSSLGESFIRSLEDLADKGIEFQMKQESNDEKQNGSKKILGITGDGHRFTLLCTPIGDPEDQRFDLLFKGQITKDDGKPDVVTEKLENIRENEITDAAMKAICKMYDVDSLEELQGQDGKDYLENDDSKEDINENTHITATFKRIVGETEDTIELTRIVSGYDPQSTLAIVNTLMNDDTFTSELTETPTTFDVEDTGTELSLYDGTECNECDCISSSIYNMIIVMSAALIKVKHIHWTCKGQDFNTVHNISENLYYSLNNMIDNLGELSVEKCGDINIECLYPPLDIHSSDRTVQGCLNELKDICKNVSACIECYYCNFSSDVQSTLDEWIRNLNKNADYFITNELG